MQELDIKDIGIIIVVAMIIVDRVFNIFKSRGIDLHLITKQIDSIYKCSVRIDDSQENMSKQIDNIYSGKSRVEDRQVKMASQLHDIHQFHMKSLEGAISELSENIKLNTKVLDKLDRKIELFVKMEEFTTPRKEQR